MPPTLQSDIVVDKETWLWCRCTVPVARQNNVTMNVIEFGFFPAGCICIECICVWPLGNTDYGFGIKHASKAEQWRNIFTTTLQLLCVPNSIYVFGVIDAEADWNVDLMIDNS